MKKILFFKIASTGPILWGEKSRNPEQPHIVQLSAILVDEKKKVLNFIDSIVKPDGWKFDDEAIKTHGVTESVANSIGTDEISVLSSFYDLYKECDFRVSHGMTFNNRMIRIAEERYMDGGLFGKDFKDKSKYLCTFSNSKKVYGKDVQHDLPSLYNRLGCNGLVLGDNSFADARACSEVYFAMNK